MLGLISPTSMEKHLYGLFFHYRDDDQEASGLKKERGEVTVLKMAVVYHC